MCWPCRHKCCHESSCFLPMITPSITLKVKQSPLLVSQFPPEMAECTCLTHPPSAVELDAGGQLAGHRFFLILTISLLMQFLNYIHAIRGMSFNHVPGSRMAAMACHLLHALVFVVACGLDANFWLFSLCKCPLAECMLQEFISTLRSAPFKPLLLNFHRTRTCFRHCSQTVNRINLKLAEHIPILIMHLP